MCKTKNNILAEYALRDMSKPIGLAEYRLSDSLPENLKTGLPTIEELELELLKGVNDTLPDKYEDVENKRLSIRRY